MASFNLPYYAQSASLPAPLPTVKEIKSATNVLNETPGRKVVVVGDYFVVKYGWLVDLLEGETQLFLEQSTTVPVPRTYALYRDDDENTNYIVMERIEGSDLRYLWPEMDERVKQSVSLKLRSIFEKMRELKSPRGFCSVGGHALPDGVFWTDNWTDDPRKPIAGPFNTERAFNQAMLTKYLADGNSESKAKYYKSVFETVLQNHSPIFSHADFQRKNVMIRNHPASTGNDTGGNIAELEVVLIDWEFAGWYPSYWEYSRAMLANGRWDDDWADWVEQMLEPYRNEYAWIHMFLTELWE